MIPTAAQDSYDIAGIRIDAVGLEHAVSELLGRRSGHSIHFCNAFTVVSASEDTSLALALNRGSRNLPDGMPIVWVGRRRTRRQDLDRVSGPDLMALCMDRGRATSVRHYLYGSTPSVAGSLRRRLVEQWPGVEIVGCESPPFGDLSDADAASAHARFVAARADIVWVGLGTPKQDLVVDRLAALGGPAFVAIGAAFDFLAGTKARAPRWMRRAGLEWFFRLASEPRRLWRRYLIGNLKFVRLVWREWR